MTTRAAIRSYLKDLAAPKVVRAFDYRAPQLLEEELPAACVFFEDGETSHDFDERDETTGRLIIEITARSAANVDAALDTLGNDIHNAIKTDDTLLGIVAGIWRIGFTYERDPDSHIGTLSVIYHVHYHDED
tara:strand:+ start:2214 stop:2609 length:396 start_codon:yes stop_codon:yes gene_type:complete